MRSIHTFGELTIQSMDNEQLLRCFSISLAPSLPFHCSPATMPGEESRNEIWLACASHDHPLTHQLSLRSYMPRPVCGALPAHVPEALGSDPKSNLSNAGTHSYCDLE